MPDEGPKKDNLVKKMEAIAYSKPDSSKFVTNEMNQMAADVPKPPAKDFKSKMLSLNPLKPPTKSSPEKA